MSELLVMESLHKHMASLGAMQHSLAPKSFVIGYKPLTYYGKPLPKFATLHGGKKYRCLVLHVDAGKPSSTKGKEIQKVVQGELQFDIASCRKMPLKAQETYIPFEVLDSKAKLDFVKEIITSLYDKIQEVHQ